MPIPGPSVHAFMASPACVAGSHTYTVDHPSVYALNSASGPESGFGDGPNRPSWEQDIVPSAEGVMRPDPHRKHWAMFVAGHLILFAVVVAEISQLFEVYVWRDDDDAPGCLEGAKPSLVTTSPFQNCAIIALISGLVFQVYFATALSLVFRSPLDMNSAHKIPTGALLSRAEKLNLYCLAPLVLAWIYEIGFVASFYLDDNDFCGWQGGSRLGTYLEISATIMWQLGLLFVLVAVAGSVVGSLSPRILSKGKFFDVAWRLQGVVWVYRAGGFGLGVSVSVGICSVVGVGLTVIGSQAPDMRHRSQEDSNTSTAVGS